MNEQRKKNPRFMEKTRRSLDSFLSRVDSIQLCWQPDWIGFLTLLVQPESRALQMCDATECAA